MTQARRRAVAAHSGAALAAGFAALTLFAAPGASGADTAAPAALLPPAPTRPVAFPGAEGFGAAASGGRGGAVYRVTTLDDAGPGSFRDAVRQGGRTVVFAVGGTIALKSPVHIASNLTLAGQTAPGEGIALTNYEVSFEGARNVIVRYLRFRLGLTPGQEKKYTLGLNRASTIILDHCSIEWGRWDCIGLTGSENITLQYDIIGEGIDPQRFGCLCQSDSVTFSHNLWINNQSRNPKAKGKVRYINNVVYNWGVDGYVGGHSAAEHWADLIGNYFIKGPSSNDRFAGEFTPTDHIYLSGNVADLDRDGRLNGRVVTGADLSGATIEAHPYFAAPPGSSPPDSAEEAYRKVIQGAGCSLHRDATDARLIAEVTSLGTHGTITHDPGTLPPVPPLRGGTAPADSDGDGIPDAWEKAHGLNPNDPADAARPADDHSGYTNLEMYVNRLAEGANR